jgi:hypothetical protein
MSENVKWLDLRKCATKCTNKFRLMTPIKEKTLGEKSTKKVIVNKFRRDEVFIINLHFDSCNLQLQ